jgi:hypothetical protein
MLTIFGSPHRLCDGASRRNFLRLGICGIGALGLNAMYPFGHSRSKEHLRVEITSQHFAADTGRSVERATSTTLAASPEVVGNGSEGGNSSDRGDDGSESGGDGGEDDPPRVAAFGDEEPRRKKLNSICRLICFVCFLLIFPFQLLPDFVTVMRLFDFVFPDDIHDNHYAPGKLRLLREICGDAERIESRGRTLWKGFWRRLRFGNLVVYCFLEWAGRLLWDLVRMMF